MRSDTTYRTQLWALIEAGAIVEHDGTYIDLAERTEDLTPAELAGIFEAYCDESENEDAPMSVADFALYLNETGA